MNYFGRSPLLGSGNALPITTRLDPFNGGNLVTTQPSQGGIVSPNVPGNPGSGIRYRPVYRSTDVNFTEISAAINVAAATNTPLELGDLFDFLDGSATALAFNNILAYSPNGRVIDLAVITRTKLGGNYVGSQQIMFPAGVWNFVNVSGGAITAKEIWAQHYDVTN